MKPLTLELAESLSKEFFGGNPAVASASQNYTPDEMLAFFRANTGAMKAEIRGMSPRQLAYRIPGAPGGDDASGDEEHFDFAQIMTHMATGTAFHWWNLTRAIRAERPPMPKPPEGAQVTGKRRDGMGAGGWGGMSADELIAHLDATIEPYMVYAQAFPEDKLEEGKSSFGIFKDLAPRDWMFLIAIHSAMHLIQVREMKAQPDYPA